MKKFLSFLIIILLFTCAKKEVPSSEVILARVGDKTISKQEFMARAEFTIRPNPFKDKYITLNNLITEKILALEAVNNSELEQNPYFQAQMDGIKEQAMREQLYYEEAFNKVQLDTNELKTEYTFSRREYELDFFSIHKDEIGQAVLAKIQSAPDSAQEIFNSLAQAGQMGHQIVKWKDPDFDQIHDALYSGPLKTDSIIGPLQLEEDNWIIMRVKDWKDYPLISGEDQQMRWNEVKEKVHRKKANKRWYAYIRGVMQGKQLEFNKETFDKLADLIREKTFNQNSRQADIEKGPNDQQSPELQLSQLEEIETMLALPLFTIDNQPWTVGDFKSLLMSHPLVYRTTDIHRRNFKKQFQYAIADLIRDHYLNQEAYAQKLDQHHTVKRTLSMWKDSYLSLHQRDKILRNAPVTGNTDLERQTARRNYWDTYIDSLQNLYRKQIYINEEELAQIQLTSVDMYVTKPGVPHPVAVPAFPQITTSKNLDYAQKMK